MKPFFEKLYGEEEEYDIIDLEQMSVDIPSIITGQDNELLHGPIFVEEVHKAVWGLHPNKSPSPDCFLINFHRKCWSFIKKALL